MTPPRRNPLTPAASSVLVIAAFGWLAVALLAACGIINVPLWQVVVSPSLFLVAAFLLWLAWALLMTAVYRVRAYFAHQRPRRRRPDGESST